MKPKFFHKMTFWQFIGYIVTPFAVVGEGAIIGLHLSPWLHVAVISSVIITAFIKYYIKDDNNDGIADKFQ